MNDVGRMKLKIRLIILGVLLLGLWAAYGKNSKPQGFERNIQITTRQLEPVNGGVPVEIRCDTAHLNAPNELQPFDCRLRNNTDKRISAAAAVLTVLVETNGVITKDVRYSSFDTAFHPDFDDPGKHLARGKESMVGPPGEISYPEGVIRGIEVYIDYVQFDDNTQLGANEKGETIIKSYRSGASRYKTWLLRKFNENGKSFIPIVPLIQADQPVPLDLGPVNSDEEVGLRAYRNKMLKLFETQGASAAQKLLQ